MGGSTQCQAAIRFASNRNTVEFTAMVDPQENLFEAAGVAYQRAKREVCSKYHRDLQNKFKVETAHYLTISNNMNDQTFTTDDIKYLLSQSEISTESRKKKRGGLNQRKKEPEAFLFKRKPKKWPLWLILNSLDAHRFFEDVKARWLEKEREQRKHTPQIKHTDKRPAPRTLEYLLTPQIMVAPEHMDGQMKQKRAHMKDMVKDGKITIEKYRKWFEKLKDGISIKSDDQNGNLIAEENDDELAFEHRAGPF